MQGFLSTHPAFLVFNWICPLLVIVMLASLCLSPDFTENHALAMVLPAGLYFTHRVMVALKYASLTESEYRKFMACKDEVTGLDYALQLQLISGLLGQHPAVLNFEIAAAATRMAVKRFSEHTVTIDCREGQTIAGAGRKDWNRFIVEALTGIDVVDANLDVSDGRANDGRRSIVRELQLSAAVQGDVTVTGDGSSPVSGDLLDYEVIPISVIITALMHRAGRASNPVSVAFIAICATGLGVCTVTLLVTACRKNVSPSLILFYTCATVILVLFYLLTALFLVTAIFAINQQWALATELGDMVDLSAASILEAERTGAASREIEHLLHLHNAQIKYNRAAGATDSDTGGDTHAPPVVPNDASDWAPGIFIARNNIGARTRPPATSPLRRPPLLMLDSAENVVSFMYMRLIIRDYGQRFQFRLDAYVGTLMQFTLLLMLGVVVKICTSPPSNIFEDMMLVQVLAVIGVGSCFMFLLVLLGARVNHLYVMHQTLLTAHVLQCEKRVAELVCERTQLTRHTQTEVKSKATIERRVREVNIEIDDRHQLLRALGAAAAGVQTSYSLQPLKVMKIVATYPLAYSIFSAVFTFAVFLYTSVPGSAVSTA
mgnify:FL=1